jgi:signal transduction histidine kinase
VSKLRSGLSDPLSNVAASPSRDRTAASGDSERVVAGVARSLGDRLGIDPFVVRLAFVVLATAGGAGIVAYVALWAIERFRPLTLEGPVERKPSLRQAIAVGFILIGVLVLLRYAGLWFTDALTWPVAAAAIGSTIIWAQSDENDGSRWRSVTSRWSNNPIEVVFTGRISPTRIIVGGLLIGGGMAGFLAATDSLTAVRDAAVPVAVTLIGVGLVLGPWMWRLTRAAVDERRERIRTQERAEVAAHLHDSVLQTLALIQRSESPREMASLAHIQERELRGWLYGQGGSRDQGLRSEIEAIAERVEEQHHVAVEVVVVGDRPLDERTGALVQACGEAITNSAQHSGVDSVSVYVEVDDSGITAFVRDTGSGFLMNGVSRDRGGIKDSIIGRMERNGGEASIQSSPGAGTEVRLHLPIRT